MIRLIQRRLIIPRGDTGSFSIPILAGKNTGDVAVFTVFDLMTQKKLLEKAVTTTNDTLTIEFNHNDTVNLPVGQFVWDIKYYVNPVFADGKLVDGEEIDSYYAAFTLPVCEIRQTGDMMLMVNDAALPPDQLDILLATLNATIAAKNEAVTSAAEADTSATNAETSASAALASQQAALDSQTAALASQQAAAASAQQALAGAELATIKAEQIATDISNKADKSEIPTKVSDLTDDSGHYTKPVTGIPASDLEETYLTQHQDISMKANSADLAAVATSGAYSDLSGTPTNVSTFTNDAGYLTQHQDISGKANSADLATVAISGSYEDLSNKPTIPDVQINGSSIVDNGIANIPLASTSNFGVVKINGAGLQIKQNYLTISFATEAHTKSGSSAYTAITPSVQHMTTFYGLAKAAGDTTQSQSDNIVGTYTDDAKTAIQQMLGVPAASAIPTSVSQLTNDSGYLTSYTETDPTVPSWAKAAQKPTYTAAEVGAPTVQEMNTAIDNAIGNINSFDMAVVQELPSSDISTHTIYLVPKTGETNDVYDEYVYINNAWEMVGNTQIDLSNYVQKTDYATTTTAGIVKVGGGLTISNGTIQTLPAVPALIKSGGTTGNPITPMRQHESVFYGLAKAAGDTTQSQSDNAVGTYTTEAKAAIRSMIGAAASADLTVQDVQANGTTIVNNGIANIPLATASTAGLVKVDDNLGIAIGAVSGKITTRSAVEAEVKEGTNMYRPIAPHQGHTAAFYGLAKAAGDTTQSQSNNAVGTYTDEAKAAIQQMLDVPSNADLALKADKTDTVLETTLSRGRKDNTTVGGASLAFGVDTEASGYYSVALGLNTTASSQGAYAEGKGTVAHYIAHAEGEDSQALSSWSHAQNLGTIANGGASSASGRHTIANGADSFVFGKYNAEDSYGNWPTWTANTSYEVGDRVKRNLMVQNEPTDVGYHCTVANSDATFDVAHWELDGYHMNYVEIVGNGKEYEDPETHQTVRVGSNAYALEWNGTGHFAGDVYVNANANSSGGTKVATVNDIPNTSIYATKADTVLETSLSRSRKDGTTIGTGSFAFGNNVEASGTCSHAEGSNTIASFPYAHAEGMRTQALNNSTHAEGRNTIASGAYSHAEGRYNIADSYDTWEEWEPNTQYEIGDKIKINEYDSGYNGYICIIANSDAQFTKTNWQSLSKAMNYIHIAGNGTADDARSNAYALDWDGNGHYMGNIYVGANADSTGGTRVATIAEVATKLDAAEAGLKVVRLI